MKKILFIMCMPYSLIAWDPFSKSDWESTGKTIKSGFETAGQEIKGTSEKAGKDLQKATEQVKKTVQGQTEQLTKDVQKFGEKAAVVFKKMGEENQDFFKKKLYQEVLVNNIYKQAIKPVGDAVQQYGSIAANMVKNWFGKKITPNFCKNMPSSLHYLRTVDDPTVIKEDTEGLIPYIKKYSPVLYLRSDEIYFPIWVTEYCCGPQTAVKSQKGNVIILPGQVTMEKIYDLYKKSIAEQTHSDTYFDIPECATYGSNPQNNRNPKGSLDTPVYVVTWDDKDKTYIQQIYFYGFNAPYDIGPFKGDIADFQDAHECDVEHMTFELDSKTKDLKRIYYGSHGLKEGFWLDAHHPDIQYEGTHPVAFVARGGHGLYPRGGTYVRIYGMANDITSKHMRWAPQLVRIYPNTDKRFNEKEMAWLYFPGTMGKRGVGHLGQPFGQSWFMNAGDDIGRKYEGNPFCKNPSWSSPNPVAGKINEIAAEAEYEACIVSQIPKTTIPT